MASRSTSIVVFAVVLASACGSEVERPPPDPRVQAFTFVGSDLLVVERSSMTPLFPKGFPTHTYHPDARLIRYADGDLEKPSVVVDGLTMMPESNSAIAVIGQRAIFRHRYHLWLIGMDIRAIDELPFHEGAQISTGPFVNDGSTIYARDQEPNTRDEYGTTYLGAIDADANVRRLALRWYGDFAVDDGWIYVARTCPDESPVAVCPEAGIYRAAPTDADFTQIVRFDPARTTLDLRTRRFEEIAVRAGRVYFTTTGGEPAFAVHVATLASNESPRELRTGRSSFHIAPTDDGVILCGDVEVYDVSATTGNARVLAPAEGCTRVEWHDGLVAWSETRGYYGGTMRTVRTR